MHVNLQQTHLPTRYKQTFRIYSTEKETSLRFSYSPAKVKHLQAVRIRASIVGRSDCDIYKLDTSYRISEVFE